MLIVGASSLHHSLEKWDNIRKRLKGKLISKPGYNLHPNAKDKYKIVQNRLRYVEYNTKIILWHDIINNTVTSPKSNNRTHINGDQLKVEIERLQRKVDIVVIVYCVREGAPDVYNNSKETEIPVLHIVKNLLSRRKQKDKRVSKKYIKLHLDHFLELKTLFSIVRNNGNLKKICKKKNSKPQKQRTKNSANK